MIFCEFFVKWLYVEAIAELYDYVLHGKVVFTYTMLIMNKKSLQRVKDESIGITYLACLLVDVG